jgi:hypothetical protein
MAVVAAAPARRGHTMLVSPVHKVAIPSHFADRREEHVQRKASKGWRASRKEHAEAWR